MFASLSTRFRNLPRPGRVAVVLISALLAMVALVSRVGTAVPGVKGLSGKAGKTLAGPLHAEGAKLVDADGDEVTLTGVNWFVPYPYVNPLGVEVGSFYSGDPTLDDNAHFWATDGLAASGLWGVILISVVCALVFWLLDSTAKGHDLRFATLIVIFEALNLGNISIFTTLLSGGLGLLMILLYFAPRNYTEFVDAKTGYPAMRPLTQP